MVDGTPLALTTNEESFPWLQIDLSTEKEVGSIKIYYRLCSGCADQLEQLEIRAGSSSQSANSGQITANTFCGNGPATNNLLYYNSEQQPYHQLHIVCGEPIAAQYVTVQLMTSGQLNIHEIEVFEPEINGKISILVGAP